MKNLKMIMLSKNMIADEGFKALVKNGINFVNL